MSEPPRILLTGVTGQVGRELWRALQPLGQIVPANRDRLNLTQPEAIAATVREIQPRLIVHPAAYTAVDLAESEPELAMTINGTATGALAEIARELGAALVYYSTDYVFDGSATVPYGETDATSPLGVYGRTKLAGEAAIRAVGVPHLILRTSWVYSRYGKNFLLTMLRLAREREELRVVDDQIGAPTWSRAIADVTAQILGQTRGQWHDSLQTFGGTYHLTAGGQTSWYGFAKAILASDRDRSQHKAQRIVPIATADYPTPARRPAYSVLRTDKLRQTFGLHLADWHTYLSLAMG